MTSVQARTGPPPVIVGVDGSPNSLAALRRAIVQAAERGTSLEMIYAVPSGADPAAICSGYTMLEAAARCVAAAGLCVHHAKRIVACGDPPEILVKRGVGAQLLVIGGWFHAEEGSLLGGDVVPYCLDHATCPVDICADQRTPERPAEYPCDRRG